MPTWDTIVQLVASIVLVGITIYYAWSAHRTFIEMQKSRNYALPMVSFDVVEHDIYITLKNHGPAPAFQPRITLATSLSAVLKPLASLAFFKKLEVIAPGQEIRSFIQTAPVLLQSQEALRFPIKIQFKEWTGNYTREGSLRLIDRAYSYEIDISAYEDIVFVRKSSVPSAA